MITGFNTDVEHDGVVYHVQTEDKGLDSPLILSLVYVGGAILASKRSHYQDLIAAGFDEGTLAERLQRQHKLICAAIHAGRIEDLKRMNQREPAAPLSSPPEPQPDERTSQPSLTEPHSLTEKQSLSELPTTNERPAPVSRVKAPARKGPRPPSLPPPPVPLEQPGPTSELQVQKGLAPATAHDQDLYLDLLEERELRGGDFVTFRIRVSTGAASSRDAVVDADVTLKVLGTAFKPLVCTARTDQDGVAILFAGLPRFSSGRAAILVRATARGYEAELRRIIQPT